MIKPILLAAVAALFAGAASAETFPGRLAAQVGNDPKADTADCRAAQADAISWNEKKGVGALRRIGRIAIWPLGERGARRRGEEKNEARELVMAALREQCFTQPPFERAPPVEGQRWPGAEGYDRSGGLDIIVGGREVAAIVHPRFNTIWVRARGGGPGYVYWQPEDFIRSVAWAIEPAGCRVTQDRPAPNNSREVAFKCPGDVNLRQLVETESPLIRRGGWPKPHTR